MAPQTKSYNLQQLNLGALNCLFYCTFQLLVTNFKYNNKIVAFKGLREFKQFMNFHYGGKFSQQSQAKN
jgi:hypothetical protein